MTHFLKGIALSGLIIIASGASFADTSRQDEVKPLKDLLSKTNTYCANKSKALQCVMNDSNLKLALKHCRLSEMNPQRDPEMEFKCEADDVLTLLPFDETDNSFSKKDFDKSVTQYNNSVKTEMTRMNADIQDYVNNGKEFHSLAELKKSIQADDRDLVDNCNELFRHIRDDIKPIIQIYQGFGGRDCEGF